MLDWRKLALGFAVFLSQASSAQAAAEMTLSDLRDICSGTDEVSKAACKFFIYGVEEGTSLAAGVAADKKHFCVPDGLDASAFEILVKGRMGSDLMLFPKDAEMPAVSFVAGVIIDSFPCKKP